MISGMVEALGASCYAKLCRFGFEQPEIRLSVSQHREVHRLAETPRTGVERHLAHIVEDILDQQYLIDIVVVVLEQSVEAVDALRDFFFRESTVFLQNG